MWAIDQFGFFVDVDSAHKPDSLVVDYRSPEELKTLLDLALPENGLGMEGTFDSIKEALKYSVNSWNPRFMDKLYAGTTPIGMDPRMVRIVARNCVSILHNLICDSNFPSLSKGVISELLIAALNTNTHVYHVSPVFTLMEMEVTKAVGKLLGMGENGGGLLCPGGSASNQLALITARNYLYPTTKTKGYIPRPYDPNAAYGRLMVFTSEHGHYSVEKAVMLMGLGTENVVKVKVDGEGRMSVDEL
ncbi:pyridoxal phosphate-dependent transferase, partial [Jimgerdemannia flammicorona]